MSKSNVFIGVAISFALGVGLASGLNIRGGMVFGGLAAAVIMFALSFDAANKFAALLALFLFFLFLGMFRLQISQNDNQYSQLFGSKQSIEGYIAEDPDIRQSNQFLTFQPKNFSQRILISAPLINSYAYGDWVVVEGKILQPENFDGFDYQKYLERYNIYAQVKYPKILMLKSHRLNPVKEFLLNVKKSFTQRVGRLLPEPQSSLLMGILIGARKTLPQQIVDNFNATGVSHIISVSGYNITIIIYALGVMALYLGRRLGFWITLTLIAGFVILSGASASVVRAAVMGSLMLLAVRQGRQYSVAPALFFAALVMLIINPKILYWDASFQLSFLATLGIIYFQPVLDRLTVNWPNPLGIKNILFTTFSAMAATLPLILFIFGRLSVAAPLVNILVIPFVPWVMLFGFLVVLPGVGPGFAFISGLILSYIIKVTEAFAAVPFSSFIIKISGNMFAVLTIFVFGLYWQLRRLAFKNSPVDEPKKI